MNDEYVGKCSVCKKDCLEIFDGKCDTCFLEEQYYGGGQVIMYDPVQEADYFQESDRH